MTFPFFTGIDPAVIAADFSKTQSVYIPENTKHRKDGWILAVDR
uniref:Uncharacterized protein n=1 Tax=Candidatus Kentrum sp. MB TaxID=2138164 RepID=A0A450XK74_9GAMM|nr:MAG: hypothetical protein BECKMB1821G_GA0114241_105219 [Candidatus Kentron sp. MB]